jgi:CRP-like cAMP-binding protein
MAMTKKEKLNLLRGVDLFSGVGARSLAIIADRMVEINFKSGDYIVRQGQVGTGFYLVATGRVRVQRGGDILAHYGPGQFFGEMSVLDQMPRAAHVIAEEPTVTLALASWDFTKVLEQHPKITLSLLREVARRLRETTNLPHH